MANTFSREEVVLFEKMLEGFNDALIVSRAANVFMTDQTTMERTGDIIWRPMPYIMTSYSGNDMTSNFKDVGQLAVPASIDTQYAVPFTLTARQLRDAMQEGRLRLAAEQKLASDINISVMNTVSLQGSIVVKRTTAAAGFDDIALCGANMDEQGVPNTDRKMLLSPRDYNNMASNLASRVLDNSKSLVAYEKARLGQVAGFDTMKMNYAYRLTAAAGVGVSVNGANQYYTPVSYTTTSGRGSLNVDNRYQNLSIKVTSGTVKVGDCFTIAGVYAVHHITKQSTGQLKTFRITAIVSGAGGTGTVTITPAIISNGGSTNIEAMYQNVSATPIDTAAITFLNTADAYVNPFWEDGAVDILPGRLAPAPESGMAVMRGTTDQGFELVMTRQGSILDLSTKYRFDAIWGTCYNNPELGGITLFSQS